MMTKVIFIIFSLLLLIYLILPSPSNVSDFPNLPNAVKSNLPGDTVQVPDVAGYFSNNYRDVVTNFYRQQFKNLTLFPILPLRLNYPPEYAYTAIKDQTQSTFLEEYAYPLRDSIFVNGFEPFYQDGTPKYEGAIKLGFQGQKYETKTTIRYYPSPIWARILEWTGIIVSIYLIYSLGQKIVKNG